MAFTSSLLSLLTYHVETIIASLQASDCDCELDGINMEGPSETLYLNNLNERVKKPVLKKLLYMLFSQYGKVIQIVACKGIKLRGQAWIVFQDAASATNAMKAKQGFVFHDKPMKIAFSKEKSDVVAKKQGASLPVRPAKRARADKGAGASAAKRQCAH